MSFINCSFLNLSRDETNKEEEEDDEEVGGGGGGGRG